jgi:hypothetical protein
MLSDTALKDAVFGYPLTILQQTDNEGMPNDACHSITEIGMAYG